MSKNPATIDAKLSKLSLTDSKPSQSSPTDPKVSRSSPTNAKARSEAKHEGDTNKVVLVPDAAYQHEDAEYPAVVLEMSSAERKRDLQALAEQYILGSEGKVCVVIGINAECETSKKVTLSVWRPQYVKNAEGREGLVCLLADHQDVRDDFGNPVVGSAGLELQLKDFSRDAPDTFTDRVSISAADIAGFVTDAEAQVGANAGEKSVEGGKGKTVQLEPETSEDKQPDGSDFDLARSMTEILTRIMAEGGEKAVKKAKRKTKQSKPATSHDKKLGGGSC